MFITFWVVIFFTQIFLPVGFQIMVIITLVFTSKIGFIVKQAVF